METGIHVGNTPGAIEASGANIIELVKLFPEQSLTSEVLIEGLRTIAKTSSVDHATVSHCTIYGGDVPDTKNPTRHKDLPPNPDVILLEK